MRSPLSAAAGAVLILLSLVGWGFTGCRGRGVFSFEMHHLFSDRVRQWSEMDGKPSLAWPEVGSYEYYAELARRDGALYLRGRRLAETGSPLAFSDGNSTTKMNSLGFLHYTTVKLGTPGKKFLVALDTGSDLFWVPCECGKCAPIDTASYASDIELSIYRLKNSSTGKRVTCGNSLCSDRDKCLATSSSCPYTVSYVSAETSTSGVLVEDILHLTTEGSGSHRESIKAYVMFGCGQVQTGSFLDVAAPNGLFGLGMERISVPSVLSREGVMANSFSMCFGRDGVGRINFGDKGSTDQDETPFNINPSHPSYNISATRVHLGTAAIDVNISALFDSGTSFTYLVDPLYSRLMKAFHSQVKDRRCQPDSRIPFEYCYDMSPDANSSSMPKLSITMKGGGLFVVQEPLIVISTQTELVYCLAVVKSTEMNIIGQNFMTGYRVVFDREKLVLGWKNFNCYAMEDRSNVLSTAPHNKSIPPAVAAGLNDRSSHQKPSANESINGYQSSSAMKATICQGAHPDSSIMCYPTMLLTRWQTLLLIGLWISS